VLGRQTAKPSKIKAQYSRPPVRTARTFVHHYNSTEYCNTETVFSIFPFHQTNITSRMWPSGGKGETPLLAQHDRHTNDQHDRRHDIHRPTEVAALASSRYNTVLVLHLVYTVTSTVETHVSCSSRQTEQSTNDLGEKRDCTTWSNIDSQDSKHRTDGQTLQTCPEYR